MKSPKGNKQIKSIKFVPESTISVIKNELPALCKEKQLKNIIINPDSVLNNSFYKEIMLK